MANLEFILYELLSTTTDIIKKNTKKIPSRIDNRPNLYCVVIKLYWKK